MKTTLRLTASLLFLSTIALAQQKTINTTKTTNTLTTQGKTEGQPVHGQIVKGGSNGKVNTSGGPIGGTIIKGGHNAKVQTKIEGGPIQGTVIKGGSNGKRNVKPKTFIEAHKDTKVLEKIKEREER